MNTARKLLDACFQRCTLAPITRAVADDSRSYVKSKGQGPNTINRHMGLAKQFFVTAVKDCVIPDNPFSGADGRVRAVDSRFAYVEPETITKFLEACPDAQWRRNVALCRHAGLRCPSEVQHLKWDEINWDRDRMHVYPPKTKSRRWVPINGFVRPHAGN